MLMSFTLCPPIRILFPGSSPFPSPGGGDVVVVEVVVGGGGGGRVDVVVTGGMVAVVTGAGVVVPPGTVVEGATPPPVDSRPGGIEKGSLDPARDTGGSVSRGVGDGVTLGAPVVPDTPVGPGSASSSPPSGRSTKRYASSSRGNAIPAICRI